MDFCISAIYVLCGLCYTIFAGRGKYIAFVFGLVSSLLYSYFAFKNSLWGSFALNFFYYVPIQILSLIKWFLHTDKTTKSVLKITLPLKSFLIYFIAAFFLSVVLSYFFVLNSDAHPYLDSFITIFSILGAYLTLKRTLEQWFIWTLVNLLTCIMWLDIKNYIVLLLWLLYLILGIVFYFQWKKEIDKLN